MTKPSLDHLEDGALIPLPEREGMPESVHVINQDSIDAINAALVTGRPLLVRGEPGTGKSQLARAAAQALGRAFIPHAVDSRTETRDLLWSVDAVARLAEAQVMGALRPDTTRAAMERIDLVHFIQPGPLWWAFDWGSAMAQTERSVVSASPPAKEGELRQGVVVLVDEIDKADPAVPNGLLDALGHGRFDVPGRKEPVVMDRGRRPLVVITTNEERSLPDAFLRRCLVLHLELPEERGALIEALISRGRAHFDDCDEAVLRKAAELLAKDRNEIKARDLSAPGLAEYIDLVDAVTAQREGKDPQLALLERISKFALRKHPPELLR